MHRFLVLILFFASTLSTAEESQTDKPVIDEVSQDCGTVIIYDVTDMAFGVQGQPVTGMVKCFYDTEKAKLKSERAFINGILVRAHNCYDIEGHFLYSIIFKDGKRHQWRVENVFRQGTYFEEPCVEDNSSVNSCLKETRNVCF